MKRSEIEKHCMDLVMPILEENGFFLWDVVYEKEGADYYLRVFIDKHGGITIDDCVTVSRALEVKLDAEDRIKDAYILEVSSPGLTRTLKRENDFKNSIGRQVDIKFYKPTDILENKRKEYTGVLEAYDDDTLTVEDEATGSSVVIDRNIISSIKLAYVD